MFEERWGGLTLALEATFLMASVLFFLEEISSLCFELSPTTMSTAKMQAWVWCKGKEEALLLFLFQGGFWAAVTYDTYNPLY